MARLRADGQRFVGAAADMTTPVGFNASLEISSVEVKLNRQFGLTALRRHRAAPAAQYPQVVEVPGARPVIRYSSVFDRWLHETDGQDLIEYLLMGTLIAVTVVAGAMSLGDSLNQWYGAVADLVAEWAKKSNCSATGMAASNGQCG